MINLSSKPLTNGKDVVSSIVIPVPPKKVFRALTNPEALKSWFGMTPGSVLEAQVDLRVGGKWLCVFEADCDKYNAVAGTYLEIEEDAKLVFSWHQEIAKDNEIIQSTSESIVEMTIELVGHSSRLTVTHRGIETVSGRGNVTIGWERALQSLSNLLAY